MALELPRNFERDLQGRHTNLVPLVIIGDYAGITTSSMVYLFVSTNRFRLGSESSNSWTSPLLLNIPSLKESIDIDKRKYKISNIKIDISNLPYDDGITNKRFSERITEHPEINNSATVECRVYWTSPQTRYFFTEAAPPQPSLVDQSYLQIYYGTIRRYTHDDEKVQLVVEDNSQATFHVDLPKNILGMGDSVPDKYKNKPIPMVYGHVDRSPCVANIEETGIMRIMADSNDSSTRMMDTYGDPITIFRNDQFLSFLRYDAGNFLGHWGFDGHQYTTSGYNPYVELVSQILTTDFAEGNLDYHSPIGFNHGLVLNTQAPQQHYINDSTDNHWESSNLITFNATEQIFGSEDVSLLFNHINDLYNHDREEVFDFSFSYDSFAGLTSQNKEVGGNILSDLKVVWEINADFEFSNVGDIGAVIQFYAGLTFMGSGYSIYPTVQGIHGYAIPAGTTTDNLTLNTGWLEGGVNEGWTNTGEESFKDAIQFRVTPTYQSADGSDTTYGSSTVDCRTSFNDELGYGRRRGIVRSAWYLVDNLSTSQFYADVQGRGALADPTMPQVIEDVLREGLGVNFSTPNDIDDLYGTLKYAFTIDKKINSKKLIEGLASASAYIPRFNNMGKFHLDVIKQTYTKGADVYGNPIDEYHLIKEVDVISHSFSRTKIDDLKTRVLLKYNWDYARKEFQSDCRVFIDMFYDDPEDYADFESGAPLDANFKSNYDYGYYGFTNNVNSTIIIDDDRGKYIRDHDTAAAVARQYLYWHANLHLKMKIRLPLKYMTIEIGDILSFDNIIGDVKPYGIDYHRDATFQATDIHPDVLFWGHRINCQQAYPVFLVTSTNKTLEYCDIECVQMHNSHYESTPVDARVGCTNPVAWNYNPKATIDDNSCMVPPINGRGASKRFDDWFLQGECPYFWDESTGLGNTNYPDDDDPIFMEHCGGEVQTDYGQNLFAPNCGRFDYNGNPVHIKMAEDHFNYDTKTGSYDSIPRFYKASNCHPEGFVKNKIYYLSPSSNGLAYGHFGDKTYSTQPKGGSVATGLYFKDMYSDGNIIGQSPDYYRHQIPSGQYFGDFFYLPLPAWNKQPTEGDNYPTVTNNFLESNAGIEGGNPGDGYGFFRLDLQIERIYDLDTTYDFHHMEVSINPTAYRYQHQPYNQWDNPVQMETKDIYFQHGIDTYAFGETDVTPVPPIMVGERPVVKQFGLGNLTLRHGDGSIIPPTRDEAGYIDDTYYYSLNVYWELIMHIRIYNVIAPESNFTGHDTDNPESDIAIKIRLGASPDGLPNVGDGAMEGGDVIKKYRLSLQNSLSDFIK
tara:strand:- start:653 stop:4561 length:3909 start_codon:yes stop_codon:yes gene_type:complete